MSKLGWHYKTGESVQFDDRVLISKTWAKTLGLPREGKVTGISGFVTVTLSNGYGYDFDMRSITFIGRGDAN